MEYVCRSGGPGWAGGFEGVVSCECDVRECGMMYELMVRDAGGCCVGDLYGIAEV